MDSADESYSDTFSESGSGSDEERFDVEYNNRKTLARHSFIPAKDFLPYGPIKVTVTPVDKKADASYSEEDTEVEESEEGEEDTEGEEEVEEKKNLSRKEIISEIFELTSRLSKLHQELNKEDSMADRLGFFPVRDMGAYLRAKKLESGFWIAQEIQFDQDIPDFESLVKDEQEILLRTFGFFNVGDGSIIDSLVFRLIYLARTKEQRLFYIKQLDNETVHSESYGLMIEILVQDKKKAQDVRRYADSVVSIKKMAQFLDDIVDKARDERTSFVSVTIGEYVLFSPLFAIIFWFRTYRKGKLLRIIFSNEQIAKDEGQHCLNGCAMYKELPEKERFTDEEIHRLVGKGVSLMDNFIEETLTDCRIPDFKIPDFKQYVRFVADDLLLQLGHKIYYNAELPFPWMKFMHFRFKTNFYENAVGEYQRGNIKKAYETAMAINSGTLKTKEPLPLFKGDIGF